MEIFLPSEEIMKEKTSTERFGSYGPHPNVNRSDSEKLSEVKLLFKSEAHIQNLYPTDMNTPKKIIEHNTSSLDEMEFFDVPQSPFWMAQEEDDDIPMPSFTRRRSTMVPTEDSDRVHGYRRDSRGIEGAMSEEKEKILEALRDIVRKCTNPDPTKRPTAREVLISLNTKTNTFCEK